MSGWTQRELTLIAAAEEITITPDGVITRLLGPCRSGWSESVTSSTFGPTADPQAAGTGARAFVKYGRDGLATSQR
jgi:hypothetical protein